jgi:hypothetical protein
MISGEITAYGVIQKTETIPIKTSTIEIHILYATLVVNVLNFKAQGLAACALNLPPSSSTQHPASGTLAFS